MEFIRLEFASCFEKKLLGGGDMLSLVNKINSSKLFILGKSHVPSVGQANMRGLGIFLVFENYGNLQ